MATDYLLNLKDADVMQMVYEQDVDLGFNWQHISSPAKQMKENIQGESNNILGGENEFFVDGETGEQVPLSRKKSIFPMNRFRPNRLSSDRFNCNDCFDFFDGNINTAQPLKPLEQNTSTWQESSQFSELTSINHPQDRGSIGGGMQAHSLTNLNQSFANTQITSPCGTVENRSANPTNTCNPTNFGSSFAPSGLYNGNGSQPFTSPHRYSSDGYSPSVDGSGNIFTPLMLSDEGSPMEGSCCSVLTTPDNQEPSFRFDQFNNYKYNNGINHLPPSSLSGRNPSMTSLPEPGQSFFELGPKPEPSGYMPSELVPGSTTATTFTQNLNSPFLNPPVSNYPPAPLRSSSSFPLFYKGVDQQMTSAIHKSGVTENCESDSSLSVDRSPKGYSYLNTISNEDFSFKTRDTSSCYMQDVKPYINNLINNTTGIKKLTKKKSIQSSHPRESRDEKRARELNLPFSLDEIILTPVEDYNEMLARTHLSAAQQALIKDIRRRGKNKVAAQNCRKRKIETITNMEEDVDLLRNRRHHLVEEQKQLEIRQHNLSLQYNTLYQQVFNSLRDESGRPYDPNQFCLDQVDGSVMVVPLGHPNHGMQPMGQALHRPNPCLDFEIKMEHSL